ncbi:MAG: hypothetical protein WKF52_09795 [Sphingomicrobium sp.]
MQNTSHAVMAQRFESAESLDNFPTPKWATRALLEEVLRAGSDFKKLSCWEPACGQGYMASVLGEYFGSVKASDIHPYGYGEVYDFLASGLFNPNEDSAEHDWIITNPPFRLGEEFILLALKRARKGVAMLTRTVFLESVGRYERLFSVHPPTYFAQFTERVPMVKGRVDAKASTATGYCWLVWKKPPAATPMLRWIPPCRKRLERAGDYLDPTAGPSQMTLLGVEG